MIEIYKKFKKFQKKIKSNNLTIGAWMQISSTEIADILSSNEQFDWICVDLEHGNFGYEKLSDIFRIIQLNGKIPFARLKSCDVNQAQQVLDLGAMGLIIPKINNSKEINLLIDSVSHPPKGFRGHAFFRANMFGKYFSEYNRVLKKPIIIAMIETKEGLNSINEILKIKQLDGIFVGPYDLSASLGSIGNFKSKLFINSIKKITLASKNHKKILGIHVVQNSKKDLKKYISKGFKFIAYSMDSVILGSLK